jgi:autotransporter-associated beta strand protein
MVKAGDGFLALSGSVDQVNFSSLGNIYLAGGTFRVSPGTNFGAQNIVYFRGGVLEIANGATLNRLATASTGGVGFEGSGGFSAYGSNAIVNLGNGTELAWGASNFFKDGDAFLFGSTQSNARLTFQNPINLSGTGYNAREFRVFDNPDSSGDVAVLSGVLSGPLLTDFLKTGDGTLELSAVNLFSGNVIVQQGTLAVSSGNALPNGGTIMFANVPGATLLLKANETVGAVSGGGALGGNINLQSNALTLGDQRDSTFAGLVSGIGGSLVKQGTGILILGGANSYSGGTTISGGAIRLGADNALPVSANPGAAYGVNLGGGTLMLNGYGIGSQSGSGAVSQSSGTLTLTANSTLELIPNDPTQLLIFSGFAPGTSTLTITGWSGSLGGDTTIGGQLLFPTNNWNPSHLPSIVFADFSGGFVQAGAVVFPGDPGYFKIVPVPEPNTAWAGGALLAGAGVSLIWRARVRGIWTSAFNLLLVKRYAELWRKTAERRSSVASCRERLQNCEAVTRSSGE